MTRASVQAKLGIIRLGSEKGGFLDSTFKYKSIGVIETEGALGKFEWVRTAPDAPKQNKEEKK